jgi:putative sigma-54 modulation protein
MRIRVKGTNAQIPPGIEEYAQRKVRKLVKYFRSPDSAEIVHKTERNWSIVEVTIEGDGIVLRGKERSDDIRSAVDRVVLKLEQQVKRFKGKLVRRSRRAGVGAATAEMATREEAEAEDLPDVEDDEAEALIVRTKRVDLKPMTPEEAVLQMELIGHPFFFFENAENGLPCVVYRRDDGAYGLIEPER